jgi:aspartyl-tRNA(Asn)/glutamyl-tRNA(Gln) amidotransferase subunit B
MEFLPTIGIEVHAELKTSTKMFCDCRNDPDEKRPNFNICPICLAHPGTLPAANATAIKHVLSVGAAVGAELADATNFDRKNYFYPDLPKGYQISQYQKPLVKGGSLAEVAITRIHLEEDTARSTHDKGDDSLVDYNRAGLPLMELVTEPVIHDAKKAGDFARELQQLLRTLGVSNAEMEKGQMRVEANISLGTKTKFGTKVEVKNINSFRAVEKAIKYEIGRQSELLSRGEKIIQETRGWDDKTETTYSQRVKEDSHDYRYFPEPDLPTMRLSEIEAFGVGELKSKLPELPNDQKARYIAHGVSRQDAERYATDEVFGRYFDSVINQLKSTPAMIPVASNYLSSDLAGLVKENSDAINKISPENFTKLIVMISKGQISSRAAKDILAEMLSTGREASAIAGEKDLLQIDDQQLTQSLVKKVISDNQSIADDYKSGKASLLQYLIGQVMKESKGKANPASAKAALLKELS